MKFINIYINPEIMGSRISLFLIIATLFYILASCHSHEKTSQQILTENDLKTFSAEIDNTRDTILHTPEGSLISITAGSFEGSNGNKVRLEIKEALDIVDIITAGLTTQSDGKMLTSGGMIDIEPSTGQNIKFVKPIRISLPTPFLDPKMMVFKGIRDEVGHLNWTDPVAMDSNKQLATINRGEQLFKQNCTSCHSVAKPVTGPALAYIARLRPQKWLFDYTRNNQEIIEAGDPYANCLYEQYNKTIMSVFPEMSTADLNSLYTYIDNESKKEGLRIPDDNLKKCVDSCQAYRKVRDSLNKVRNKLMSDNGSGSRYISTPAKGYVSPDTTGPSKLSPTIYPAVHYQFQITSFGWYNIDRFLQGMEGVENSKLIVKIEGDYRSQMSVYLIVSQAKVFEQGGPTKYSVDQYAFFDEEGGLPLLQNVSASVIAIGEQQGQLVFDLVNFTTSKEQTLTLNPVQVTKEAMNKKIRRLRLDSLNMSMNDSKNAEAIRNIDQRLESLKPKICDFNCGFKQAPVESDSTAFAK